MLRVVLGSENLDNVCWRRFHNANAIRCMRPHPFRHVHRKWHSNWYGPYPGTKESGGEKTLAHLKRVSSKGTQFDTLMPNNVLKSSMMMWRSSMWRRVFLMPLAEYNGGLSASDGGDGINASNCKLSSRLWQTSFVFDMDNCINFSGWYSKENRIN